MPRAELPVSVRRGSRRIARASSLGACPRRDQPRFSLAGGAACAVLLGLDVDAETTALAEDPRLAKRLSTMSQCTYGPTVGVPRLLGLLAHLDLPATFFVPGWVAEHHPRMLRAIADGGHEIGVHGWLHERLPALDNARREIDFDVLAT